MSTNKKQIIKLTPEQVFKQILTNSKIANRASTQSQPASLNNLPPFLEKTCGLFDSEQLDKSKPNISESNLIEPCLSINLQSSSLNLGMSAQSIDDENFFIFDDIINMKMDTDSFEECQPITDYLINNFGSEEFNWSYGESSDSTVYQLNSPRPIKEKSKFAKKLENANLRIQIEPSNPELCSKNLIADLFNPIVTETDICSLITPSVEKNFNQVMQSIPTCEIIYEPTNVESLMLFDPKEENEWNHVEQVTQIPLLSIDHNYNKHDFEDDDFTNGSLAFEDNTLESMNINTESATLKSEAVDSSAPIKKKRPRGVYRKDDVRNEEDLQNYIQRRRKNNVSSKVSRANKKAAYKEIDSKIDFLFNSNQKMNRKIINLEKINKMIKDMLVERLAKNSNT